MRTLEALPKGKDGFITWNNEQTQFTITEGEKEPPATPFLSEAPQDLYEQQQMAFYHWQLEYMRWVQDFDAHRGQEPQF